MSAKLRYCAKSNCRANTSALPAPPLCHVAWCLVPRTCMCETVAGHLNGFQTTATAPPQGVTEGGACHAAGKGCRRVAVICEDLHHRRAALQGLRRQLPTPQHVLQVLELHVGPVPRPSCAEISSFLKTTPRDTLTF
jgi:hypothetical protein